MKKKRKKRLLIEVESQEYLIQCDNPGCDYKVKNPTGDIHEDGAEYINKPCPECGQNLLTERDYIAHKSMVSLIDWLNKWFSWVMFFIPRNWEYKKYSFHAHEGLVEVKKGESNDQ